MNKKLALAIAIIITGLVITNFNLFSLLYSPNELESVIVARAIDGDTLQLTDSRTIRLININTPERNEPGYEEAKAFLQELENKSIQLETLGLDKYKRTLARVYAPDYINLAIIQNGLGNNFLVRDEEAHLFSEAEQQAINAQKGIWKHSIYYSCLKAEINEKQEEVEIINFCQPIKIQGWTLKDESRQVYEFNNIYLGIITLHSNSGEDNETDIFWKKDEIWNNDRDSIYIKDNENALVFYNNYGY